MSDLLSIGEMARLFNLNKQTLHFYDRTNLFQPQIRDEKTGYRKYELNQMYMLALICYLRRLGFSIEETKEYINLRNVDSTIKRLKERSAVLREQYSTILGIDQAIERKLYFVEQKCKHIKINEASIQFYPKRAYLSLGREQALYQNETFYFYPTIALYDGSVDLNNPTITFGAYIDAGTGVDEQVAHKLQYIEQQRFLCFVCQGDYESLQEKIQTMRVQYAHLPLESRSIHFNIIDQFLEKNMENYLTEIQIPIADDKLCKPI